MLHCATLSSLSVQRLRPNLSVATAFPLLITFYSGRVQNKNSKKALPQRARLSARRTRKSGLLLVDIRVRLSRADNRP